MIHSLFKITYVVIYLFIAVLQPQSAQLICTFLHAFSSASVYCHVLCGSKQARHY